MMNNVMLMGRLTRDAELRETESGKKVTNIPNMESFMEYTQDEQAAGSFKLTEKSQSFAVTLFSLLSPFGLLIIFLIFWFLFLNGGSQGGNKTMSFGKSKARMIMNNEKNKVTFGDVAGVDEEKEELQEIV